MKKKQLLIDNNIIKQQWNSDIENKSLIWRLLFNWILIVRIDGGPNEIVESKSGFV